MCSSFTYIHEDIRGVLSVLMIATMVMVMKRITQTETVPKALNPELKLVYV